jgi:hypothetical protein
MLGHILPCVLSRQLGIAFSLPARIRRRTSYSVVPAPWSLGVPATLGVERRERYRRSHHGQKSCDSDGVPKHYGNEPVVLFDRASFRAKLLAVLMFSYAPDQRDIHQLRRPHAIRQTIRTLHRLPAPSTPPPRYSWSGKTGSPRSLLMEFAPSCGVQEVPDG